MAQTKFSMIGNIVKISEKFWFLMSKRFSPPFEAFVWGETGQKMNKKQKKVCEKIFDTPRWQESLIILDFTHKYMIDNQEVAN